MSETGAVRFQEEGRPCCTHLRSLLRRPQVLEDKVWGGPEEECEFYYQR